MPDWLGVFANASFGVAEIVAVHKAANDDYSYIMAEALADRLAEAFAEKLHQIMRKEVRLCNAPPLNFPHHSALMSRCGGAYKHDMTVPAALQARGSPAPCPLSSRCQSSWEALLQLFLTATGMSAGVGLCSRRGPVDR